MMICKMLFCQKENERKRLEEIIIENVQLKEDLDKTTDELVDSLDELTFIRNKYEQIEVL